jgi:hypothetical protein
MAKHKQGASTASEAPAKSPFEMEMACGMRRLTPRKPRNAHVPREAQTRQKIAPRTSRCGRPLPSLLRAVNNGWI